MIAFIRPPEEPPRHSAPRRMRGLLAAMLLPPQTARADDAPPMVRWKAWLFAGWLVAVAAWAGFQAIVALF